MANVRRKMAQPGRETFGDHARAGVGARALPTMADVARKAGVSVMTVSRVMNGRGGVSEDTRLEVARAAADLHYAANREARALTGSGTIRIGLLYPDSSAGYLSEFLIGLLGQSSLNDVQFVVRKCTTDRAEAEFRRLLREDLDGLILPPPLCDDEGVMWHAGEASMPVTVVARDQPNEHVGAVCVDDREAAYHMTSHLISLGHRRIGFMAGYSDQGAGVRRLEGYRAAIEEMGVDRSEDLVVKGAFSYRAGLDAAQKLLGLADRPTAVFAGNDVMAAATVAVAHCLGLDVPRDLTVAGFDDSLIATAIWPELTTIRQPFADMARAAVHGLVVRVRALRNGLDVQPEQVCLGFELVRRQSDAAPRRMLRR
jgi:LacI family transcriptional regulator